MKSSQIYFSSQFVFNCVNKGRGKWNPFTGLIVCGSTAHLKLNFASDGL